METSAEVLRAVAAIVSAFQTAADTLEFVKERREKKRRKKDKDLEELYEIKILHRSLVDGAIKCRKHCENRHLQFGVAFESGDAIAIPALKDVVISLQTEVMQGLHIGRAVENAILDFTSLHESSVTCRKDAMRAMDQLCQRIMASMQMLPQHNGVRFDASNPSDASMRSGFVSMVPQSESNESHDPSPSLPTNTNWQINNPRFVPQRSSVSIRRPSDVTNSRGDYSIAQAPPQGRPARTAILQAAQNANESGNVSGPSSSAGDEQQSQRDPDEVTPDRTSQFSIQESIMTSERSSVQVHSAPYRPLQSNPVIISEPQQPPIANYVPSEHALQQTVQHSQQQSQQVSQHPLQQLIQSSTNTELSKPLPSPPAASPSSTSKHTLREKSVESAMRITRADAASITSSNRTAHPRPSALSRIESPSDLLRALEAPEVVTKDFGVMFSMRPIESSLEACEDPATEKYLAYRTQSDYAESLFALSPGMDNIWVPLSRPAMHNRYHGFCRGAWQMRKEVHEGLEIQMTPALKEPTIHWACRVCKFKSKAPNADAMPDQIHFNQKYAIRYRWLFLAKSHRTAETSHENHENYQYGCIFCAAQGHTTAVHDKLEHLMLHIISKHKTTMMTPEIKQKTKCIVGDSPNASDDWDVNIPETNKKGTGFATDEFLMSASRFLSRRKGKRP